MLICDTCGERYTHLQLVEGEPCPKWVCEGTLKEEDE